MLAAADAVGEGNGFGAAVIDNGIKHAAVIFHRVDENALVVFGIEKRLGELCRFCGKGVESSSCLLVRVTAYGCAAIYQLALAVIKDGNTAILEIESGKALRGGVIIK